MEFRDFYEDFEKGILKPEFKRERAHELSKWIHEHCKHQETYRSGEMTENGINFKYVATDEELLAKWQALEENKRIILLPGEMRRIGILKRAKLEASIVNRSS